MDKVLSLSWFFQFQSPAPKGEGWVEKSSSLVQRQHTHNYFNLQVETFLPHSTAPTVFLFNIHSTDFKNFIAQQKDRPSKPSESLAAGTENI